MDDTVGAGCDGSLHAQRREHARRSLAIALLAIGLAGSAVGGGNAAALRPYTNGVTASITATGASTTCPVAFCLNVRTTDTCNVSGTAICGVYSAGGTSSDAAGRSSTSGDPGVAGETIYSGGERLYNNGSTGRPACVYAGTGYNGTSCYRRANAGSGWNTAPFTGFRSVAAIPNSSSWVCWS